jgi:glucokinase
MSSATHYGRSSATHYGRSSATHYVIAGDIGGTNSRIRLYEAEENADVLVKKDYKNQDHESFKTILLAFMDACADEMGIDSTNFTKLTIAACFACAGPVKNNKCTFSNNSFVVDGNAIEEELKLLLEIHVSLISFSFLFFFPIHPRFI